MYVNLQSNRERSAYLCWIFKPLQSGCSSHHFIGAILFRFPETHNQQCAKSNGQFPGLISLEFSPAFDMVAHSLLPEQRTFCSSATPHSPSFLATSMSASLVSLAGSPLLLVHCCMFLAQCLALFSMYIHSLGDCMLTRGFKCYLSADD